MKIAVVGNGNVGSTLSQVWQLRGHEVKLAVRNPNPQALAPKVLETTLAEGVKDAEVVVFAVPYAALVSVATSLDLEGKILVDCTNPVAKSFNGLETRSTSAAEELAQATGSSRVVKSFNTVGFEVMADPMFNGVKATMLLCGDDADAKAVVA